MAEWYIASCVFTSKHPYLSKKVLEYVHNRGIPIVRCCVHKYKEEHFRSLMPDELQDEWMSLPDSMDLSAGDTVYSICHNCMAIIEETRPDVNIRSIWELIDDDKDFHYPDLDGKKMIIQDCWRSFDRFNEQDAVRSILRKLNATAEEQDDNRRKNRFCGISLYRPAPPRNLKLAPHRFVDNARGLFAEHSPEEQKGMMNHYCSKFGNEKVVCYCHYCLEGLQLGGANAVHLASLLFEK